MGLDEFKNAITGNLPAVAIGVGAAAVGAGVLGVAAVRSARKKKASTNRGRRRDRKMFNKSQKWEVAYRKRKRKLKRKAKRSRGKIRYTKNGQPYKILANGRARFIKRKRRSKK